MVLASELQVDTVLFPTAWMNVLPFLTAVEFHSAWAMGMGVNLLSANTHNTIMSMTGELLFLRGNCLHVTGFRSRKNCFKNHEVSGR